MPMHSHARPGRLLLATTLGLVLSACGEPAAPATAPDPAPVAGAAAAGEGAHQDAAQQQVYRFSIGTLQAAMLRDGDIRLPNDGSIVARGEPKQEVDALLAAAGQPLDILHLAVQSLLVRSADRVILFDTGAGSAAFADGGRLPASLQAAGVEAAAVTDIFISHAHGDHVGGLLDDAGQPAFPNATVRMTAPEWQALQDDSAQQALVAAIAPRVQAFAPGAADIVPGVSAVAVDGHTPGHSAYDIVDGDAHLLYVGDTVHHHVISVQRPRWTIQFDGNAPLAEDSREALLARAADQSLLLASPHFPYPGLGRIVRRGDGFAWAAEY